MKQILLLSCALVTLWFSSCNSEEVEVFENKKAAMVASNDVKSKTLEHLMEKYGNSIEHVEKDVVYFDKTNTYSGNDKNDTISIEIAFPHEKRDLVTFTSGSTIEVVDSFYIYQGALVWRVPLFFNVQVLFEIYFLPLPY